MVHRIEDCCDIHLTVNGIKCWDCRFQDRGTDGYNLSATQPCNFCVSEKDNCYWTPTGITVV